MILSPPVVNDEVRALDNLWLDVLNPKLDSRRVTLDEPIVSAGTSTADRCHRHYEAQTDTVIDEEGTAVRGDNCNGGAHLRQRKQAGRRGLGADTRGVTLLMSSTPLAYPQVVSRHFMSSAYSNRVFPRVS